MNPVVVDDRDAQIDYLTPWYKDPGQGTDFDQTVSVSDNPNAAFQFKFTGTSVSVYGSIPTNNTAVTTYTIDFEAPVSFTNTPSSSYLSRQLCFQSHNLADGPHTLIVTVPKSTIGLPWTSFHFDYLTYTPSGADSTTTTAVEPQPVSATSSQSKPASPTPSPQTSQAAVSSPTSHALAESSSLSFAPNAAISSVPTSAPSQTSAPSANTSLSGMKTLASPGSSAATLFASSAGSSSATSQLVSPATPSDTAATAPTPGTAGDVARASSARSSGANLPIILPAVLVPLVLLGALCQYATSSTSLVRRPEDHTGPAPHAHPSPAYAAAHPVSSTGIGALSPRFGTHTTSSYGGTSSEKPPPGGGWRGSGMESESGVLEDAPPSYTSALG
ncbi:hypothetical protein PHLGIDRAFT_123668 [Phlebiopsis gigantea 11061_1 CR5-6]|uniref:Uncharacterized protein n=1 Tax=Phlebiopsis gigantea (strain 11061_1 CR5-6) TaxID=745531 RepID=A0A0C3S117_PHLG1|nr:hypothetical protein PHLGIDRAFT_123668 [Phlebiopsis gigantea 11061_1 CR5-6]